MKYIKIAGAALNQTPLEFQGNTRNIINAIEEARLRRVAVLCLPEMAISGYGCEDTFFSDYVIENSLACLREIIEACEDITVTVGLPLVFESCVYNCVAVIHNEELLGFVAKQELPGDGIYYEPRWFKPWPEDQVVAYWLDDERYPFGDIIFQIDDVRLGLEICEDAWNGDRPAQRHYKHNVDLILNPSASNFAFGKAHTRERLVTEASRSYNCTYVYSNLLGNEAGRILYDGEILIAQGGDLIARNQRFRFADYQLVSAVVDVHQVRTQRKKSFNFRPVPPHNLIYHETSLPTISPDDIVMRVAPIAQKEREFYLAETLGLFDYMRKSRSRGFIISLSGGADSSTCAVLAAKALQRAELELGRDAFLQKLSYANLDPERPVTEQLLTCVYQGTANSGPETLESARELAEGLGATFHHWEVEEIHQQYRGLAEQSLGRELSWEKDDIALQNIQSRLRSPGIWMMANIQKALLLTTSNRSEAAVGYATMDGDTSGGLAPLGGVDKAFVIDWLKWAEEALDIPSLKYVNGLQPTAELRPADYDQTDEADLMPYDLLEEIEDLAIGRYLAPKQVYEILSTKWPDNILRPAIRKFFSLWTVNQWKRERYAPSFHLDDKNLDPKTWCRFPILNGGFWHMLNEMEE
ncbi:MAG: NAD(+) synthase [Bacteroidota bacterium]